MLSIALPKGRLAEKTLNILSELDFIEKDFDLDNRKLIFKDNKRGLKYFMVKPSDVPIYVEYGVADIGVVGKDILLEYSSDVYELLDLKMGKCKVCVAAKSDFCEDNSRPLRVATKFTNIAKNYYSSIDREIEIIKLNGSIELAPLLNMSDVIVDLVETGTTLRENNLKVIKEIMDISARLIANKSSYKFKTKEIDSLLKAVKGVINA